MALVEGLIPTLRWVPLVILFLAQRHVSCQGTAVVPMVFEVFSAGVGGVLSKISTKIWKVQVPLRFSPHVAVSMQRM